MALWGTADGIYSPGTVTVNFANKTITGTGTSFKSAGITTGTIISIGVGITYGEAVISGITSETYVSIASTQFLKNTTITGAAYTMSQKPMYVLHDPNYSESKAGLATINSVYGVDLYEAQAAINTQQKVAHAGWVGVHTYFDCHGNYRMKSEVLVAFAGITTGIPTYSAPGDGPDDDVFKDYLLTIVTQPSNRTGILTTATTSFSVVASAAPNTTIGYQWQYKSGVGAAYTNLTEGLLGIYSNVTSATIGIGSTTSATNRPNGYYFRVGVSTTAATTVYSNDASLTYA